MNGLPVRDGKDALAVNWFEVTVTSPSGQRLCHSNSAADIPAGADNVAEPAECARARWKAGNNTFKALKDGYRPGRSFGRGKETPASPPAACSLTAFLMRSAASLACESWREAQPIPPQHTETPSENTAKTEENPP